MSGPYDVFMSDPIISKEQVHDWLDEDILREVEELEPGKDEIFLLKVVTNDWEMGLTKKREDGPLIITATIGPPPEVRSNLVDMPPERRNLQMRLELLLTDMPGIFFYETAGGKLTKDLAEMENIVIQKRIYPDGASQNTLMNAILDITSRQNYIRNITDLLMDDIDDSL
jgi:hypothetical protein